MSTFILFSTTPNCHIQSHNLERSNHYSGISVADCFLNNIVVWESQYAWQMSVLLECFSKLQIDLF